MSDPQVPLFPLFLKLAGRSVLLVGGGPVATTKARVLLEAQARLTVVAPQIQGELRGLLAGTGAVVHEREFLAADLDDCWLVVAAAPPEVNRQVLISAEPRRLFVNSVDDPQSATAYSAAVVRKGPVTLAVSTGGAAPALAGLLREGLEAVLPEEMALWGTVADQARQQWKAEGRPMGERRALLLAALNRLYEDRAVPARVQGDSKVTPR